MNVTYIALAVSLTHNAAAAAVIAGYMTELKYVNNLLAYWRANALLRDPKTGRYVKKGH